MARGQGSARRTCVHRFTFVLERCCFEMGRKWSYTHGGIDRLPGCKLRREKDSVNSDARDMRDIVNEKEQIFGLLKEWTGRCDAVTSSRRKDDQVVRSRAI